MAFSSQLLDRQAAREIPEQTPAELGRHGQGRATRAAAGTACAAEWQQALARSALRRSGPWPPGSGRGERQPRRQRLRVRAPFPLQAPCRNGAAVTAISSPVDASGSAARSKASRESQGATGTMLLADFYVAAATMALIAYRKAGCGNPARADRSLVRGQAALSGLPGGGGTPLAAGHTGGCQARPGAGAAQAATPSASSLTDGRANVALDGPVVRAGDGRRARTARRFPRHGAGRIVIDNRPTPPAILAVARTLASPNWSADNFCPGRAARAGRIVGFALASKRCMPERDDQWPVLASESPFLEMSMAATGPTANSASSSRRAGCAGMFQVTGEGPRLLLLHGTGAATHSWRDLLPILARRFTVIALDLPGHGFTAMPASAGLSLRGMAGLVDALLQKLGGPSDFAVGHSAGAAILTTMAIQGLASPKSIIALNGALLPMRGAGLFGPLARLLFLNPLAPRIFAWRAEDVQATRRLLKGTGSQIDEAGVELYARLFRRSGHVAATLRHDGQLGAGLAGAAPSEA